MYTSNETLKTIFNRKSIRSFIDKPIPKEIINVLLRAGMAAPSAKNRQLWEFFLIDDKNILKDLSEKLPHAKMLVQTPAAIMICGDTEDKYESGFWDQDCSAATENILLAAESLSLGAVWIGIYPREDRVKIIQDIFKLPKNIVPLNVVPVGYPNEDPELINKWNPSKLHHNIW